MQAIFGKLNNSYAKYYSPTEHLPVMKSLYSSKVVIFTQYTPKQHKQFGTKLYTLCDTNGYTSMTTYSSTDRICVTPLTVTHATVTGLVARIEHVEHK